MRTTKLLLCFLVLFPLLSSAQGTWTQKASYPLQGRQYCNGFSIGTKGYYTFGCYLNSPNSKTVVEYDPATDTWTQKGDFPGGTRIMSHVFVIDTLAYFVSGAYWSGAPSDYTGYNDMWVYNSYDDSWTQLNNFPGTPRHGGFAFSFSGKGYFGMGIDGNLNFLNDFWEYNPATDTWTQKTSFPGVKRKSGFQFCVERYAYVGLGYDCTLTALGDVWRYDAFADTWTQMNDFPEDSRCWLSSMSTKTKGYIVTGYLLNSSASTQQFWEYNTTSDSWTALPDFGGIARATGSGFTIDDNIYNGLGYEGTYLDDFWVYTPTTKSLTKSLTGDISIITHPDPASTEINIEIPQLPSEKNIITIYDITGRIVTSMQINGNPQLVNVNCSSWPSGEYFVVLKSGNSRCQSSVVIK